MLKNFRETDPKKSSEMKKQLDAVKLEKVRSLWYLITSSSGKLSQDQKANEKSRGCRLYRPLLFSNL